MQACFAVVKQRVGRAWALELLGPLRENLSVSDPKHLLGREPESALLIAILYFIYCLVFIGDFSTFTAHPYS